MKNLLILYTVLCIFAITAPACLAADYQLVMSRDGVDVMIQYDPLGPNNEIVAYVKFSNENPYRVEVNWKPVITCEGEDRQEGPSATFFINEGEDYVVTLWRLSVCGQRPISSFFVEMDATMASP